LEAVQLHYRESNCLTIVNPVLHDSKNRMLSIGRILTDVQTSLDEQRGALSASLADRKTALAFARTQLANVGSSERAKSSMLAKYVSLMETETSSAKEALEEFQAQNCEGLTNESVSVVVTHSC
jgi:hypothetical protein